MQDNLANLIYRNVYNAFPGMNGIMAEWEKEIAELKTDVKYIREDVNIMQKQIRDLNKHTNMGLGGIKVLLIIGAVVGAIWTVMKIMSGKW